MPNLRTIESLAIATSLATATSTAQKNSAETNSHVATSRGRSLPTPFQLFWRCVEMANENMTETVENK